VTIQAAFWELRPWPLPVLPEFPGGSAAEGPQSHRLPMSRERCQGSNPMTTGATEAASSGGADSGETGAVCLVQPSQCPVHLD